MKPITNVKSMQRIAAKIRRQGKTIGFVPTMGALHEGHRSLIYAARKACDMIVVSIFVNPTQFGPKEDFTTYPRDLKADSALCRAAGVDFLFCPTAEQMYPSGFQTFAQVEELGKRLCGPFRPGHFRGVVTVVLKLFQILQPHQAFFGQKDFQQSRIVHQMTRDMAMPIRIRTMPTVREPDGLAMSSRNTRLNREERRAATVLYRGLKVGEECSRKGERSSDAVRKKIIDLISREPLVRLEYLEIVGPENFEEVKEISSPTLIAIAAWVGKTRLIDNVVVNIGLKKPGRS